MESGKSPDRKRKAQDPSASSSEEANTVTSDASVHSTEPSAHETKARSNAARTLLPANNCILFGRGKSCNNHKGNKTMRSIIDRYRDQYVTSARGEKYKLVRKVYDELVDGGMQFLKPADGQDGWVEVDAEAAIQKVGHALRSSRSGASNNPKSAKGEHYPLDDGRKLPGTIAGRTVGEIFQDSSAAAPTGALQQQLVGLQGPPGWSTQISTGLASSSGLAAQIGSGIVQEQATPLQAALQALVGSSISVGRGAATGDSVLNQDRVGIGGNDISNPLLSLERYRREMELEQLRLALLGPLSPTILPRVLSLLTANELYGMAEQDDQLRELLLYYLSRKT